jgi:hypothetical protein
MYEWLDQELREIRWRRFHVVDGPASDRLRAAIEGSHIPVSPSYRQFALRFGNAKLYRVLGTDYWRIGVFAAPREAKREKTGEDLLWVGNYGEVNIYFRADELVAGQETPIYQGGRNGFRRVADAFDSWLQDCADRTREKFKKSEWQNILRGPDPFTSEELRIVEARRLYRWRVLGFSDSGNVRFEVTNGSRARLPYLSVGIRAKDGSLDGGVWLPVATIAPGQTAIIEKDVYRGLLEPLNLEAYSEPDPEPEERERYWEFRK